MTENIVNHPRKGESRKGANPEKKPKQKRDIKPEQMPADVLEFAIRKGPNLYGFIHIPKKARNFLPFEQGVPLHARVDIDTESLIIKKKV